MCSSSLPEAISRKPVNYTIKLPRLQMKCMPRDAVIQGLYLYAIDMISSLGSDGARESVTECERLMREIAGFWGYESPALDDLYAQIRASLKDQEAWENTVEIGGIQ